MFPRAESDRERYIPVTIFKGFRARTLCLPLIFDDRKSDRSPEDGIPVST